MLVLLLFFTYFNTYIHFQFLHLKPLQLFSTIHGAMQLNLSVDLVLLIQYGGLTLSIKTIQIELIRLNYSIYRTLPTN